MSVPSEVTERIETERAILKTILYSDLFDYPLTTDEVAHYLMEVESSADAVRSTLAAPVLLDGQIAQKDGYVMAWGRESLVELRLDRSRSSEDLWRRARRFGHILSCMPFVRMVGVTGALAMNNSPVGDDVDVFIVTAPGRVWLARAAVTLIVYGGRLFGSTLCPNYFISENALMLESRTIYVAHEFVQMVPIYGVAIHARMRAANQWIDAMMPNARRPYRSEPEHHPALIGRSFKKLTEWLLSGRLGDFIEEWEMRRKLQKFLPRLSRCRGSAVMDRDHVKGHFNDHAARLVDLYQERLEEFPLAGLTGEASRSTHN